jgi:hypothetical protein
VLKLDLKVGESFRISGSGSARITLLQKSGQLARLEIDAEASLKITRPTPSVRDVVGSGIGAAA